MGEVENFFLKETMWFVIYEKRRWDGGQKEEKGKENREERKGDRKEGKESSDALGLDNF